MVGWISRATALLARIGVDPEDDAELREKKTLLVLLAVLILPVSAVWGSAYLALGSPVGFLPYVYFAVSIGSLLLFARTGSFRLLLVIQLLDILVTTAAGQIWWAGSFRPEGSGCGASWRRSEPSCSSTCDRPSAGSSRSSSSSCSWGSQARSCSPT